MNRVESGKTAPKRRKMMARAKKKERNHTKTNWIFLSAGTSYPRSALAVSGYMKFLFSRFMETFGLSCEKRACSLSKEKIILVELLLPGQKGG
jgi:hypothetical protein